MLEINPPNLRLGIFPDFSECVKIGKYINLPSYINTIQTINSSGLQPFGWHKPKTNLQK
jgi:hypothetical protein